MILLLIQGIKYDIRRKEIKERKRLGRERKKKMNEFIDMEFFSLLSNQSWFAKWGEKFYNAWINLSGWKLFLDGLKVTLVVSAVAVLIGVLVGFILALMKLTEVKKGRRTILSTIAGIYIDIIRGTPSLVQLMIMYFIVFKSQASFTAGMLAFGLNSAAYVAEIIRGGILSVNKGQMEAGRSLGLSYGMTMCYVIVPQAIKTILPALGNEFIVLIKETSVISFIGVADIMKAGQFLISRTYEPYVPYISIAVIYYIIIKILSLLLNAFERRLRKNDTR